MQSWFRWQEPGTQHANKSFTCFILFNPQNNPGKVILLLDPFYWWGNWRSLGIVWSLPKVMGLVREPGFHPKSQNLMRKGQSLAEVTEGLLKMGEPFWSAGGRNKGECKWTKRAGKVIIQLPDTRGFKTDHTTKLWRCGENITHYTVNGIVNWYSQSEGGLASCQDLTVEPTQWFLMKNVTLQKHSSVQKHKMHEAFSLLQFVIAQNWKSPIWLLSGKS